MHTNIVNTYACKKATPNSNKRMAKSKTKTIKKIQILIEANVNVKPETKNTKVCPAIILALNLIAKLKALIAYEKISIGTSRNKRGNGASGTKIFKNFKLCVHKPIKKID